MAASFGPETPVLSYGPRAHANPGPRNDRVWVLWPAWAFRVIAPEFRRRPFNALQKAVLGVLRASRLTAAELGQRLGIHPELAAFVVTELQSQGRVDDEWAVTGRGIELLGGEREDSTNLAPGWAFRDPWNDHLWPFVAPSLEYARTGRDERNNVVLELGTTGTPWQQRVWMQFPPDGQQPAAPPDAHQILRAARGHRRFERRRQEFDVPIDEDDIETGSVAGLDLNRVASIEPVPEPVFLVSFLYVPRDGDDADWHACEFFGRGSDRALRRLVVRVAEENQGLARRLDGLLGLTSHNDFAEFRRAEKERDRRARRLLERTLTLDIARHEDVADALAETIERWLELHDLGDAAGRRRRRDVLTPCRRTLERLFAEIRKEWPLTGMADRFSRRDREMNEAVLRVAADELGLSELPDALCHVTHRQISAVSDYGDSWRLRAVIAATLLRARSETNHPLRSAARKAPDLLGRIERVVELAGKAVHDDGSEGFNPESVDTSVQETLEIVGVLLNLPARPIKEILRDGQEQEEPPQ